MAAAVRVIGGQGDIHCELIRVWVEEDPRPCLHAITTHKHLSQLNSRVHVACLIARALGMLGSSWAWRAIETKEGKARGKEGLEARRIATEALVDGFARFDKARRGHLVGLSMVQYPGLRGIAEQRRGSIDPGAFAQLERIVERVEQRNSR